MKLKGLILFGILISSGILQAQTDFKPGYIIKTTGDTIFGQIDYRGDLLMSSVCKFKDKENIVKEYFPNDIMAFRFIEDKYYISREINLKKVFLQYLIKGKISIYYNRDENGDHYYLDKDNLQLTEIPYEDGIKYVDNKQVFYESKKHIGILNYYMREVPELQTEIATIKKPDRENLIELAENYNNTVCKGEKCIIYERNIPLIKILPELIGGVIKYSNAAGFNNQFYMLSGLIGHIWMPRASEKLYFRTGVLFLQPDIDGKKSNFYKIPLQLEYIYPKGIFRPRFAYGFNYYNKQNYNSVSFNFGGNIKLSETFFLSVTSDIEFNPVGEFLPKDLLSHSLTLGLFLKL